LKTQKICFFKSQIRWCFFKTQNFKDKFAILKVKLRFCQTLNCVFKNYFFKSHFLKSQTQTDLKIVCHYVTCKVQVVLKHTYKTIKVNHNLTDLIKRIKLLNPNLLPFVYIYVYIYTRIKELSSTHRCIPNVLAYSNRSENKIKPNSEKSS
jgi:hypothetical protein